MKNVSRKIEFNMKNKFISGSVTGQAFEDEIDRWLNDAKIEFYEDKTLSNSKRRHKDIKCDRRCVVNGNDVFIELKTTTDNTNLTFGLYNDGKTYQIKPHQIHKADYLIIKFRPNKPLVITKKEFILWACSVKKKSIMYKDAIKIGFPIDNMRWLYDIRRNTE